MARKEGPGRWASLSLEKKLSLFVAPLAVAVIAGVLVPTLLRAAGADDKEAALQVVGLAVTDTPNAPGVAGGSTIDITLRNRGTTVSVITGVSLTVRDAELLRICKGGAALGPSATYDVVLPPDARPGDVIDAPVSQQVAADEADRFTVSVTVPEPQAQLGTSVYRLDVGLRHDGRPGALPAGTAIVAVPLAPTPWHFDSSHIIDTSDPLAAEEQACFDGATAAFERVLEWQGARDPALDAGLLESPLG